MLCKDAEELIRKYKAGSITAENFLLLVAHTKECPNCKALFEEAEASLGKVAKENFFSSMYNRFLEWTEKKYAEGKFYTRKNVYIISTILLSFLTFLYLAIKRITFNEFFFVLGLFIVIISFFVMLIIYLLKE